MLTASLQAAICLAFEAYTFGEFQSSLGPNVGDEAVQSQYRTIPTFLTLLIFAFLYQLVLVWDALRMKNTIQIIGICISNVAFLVYTAIQIDQIQKAITVLEENGALNTGPDATDVWKETRPFLVAIPCIISLTTLLLSFFAYKLYQEFAWDILKQIGADYRMKQRFLHYQIYIALLKFDFFFFLGFTIQFLVIVNGIGGLEFGLTIAAIPVTILILLAAAVFTRHENTLGSACVIFLYFGGLAYFFFKLVRIYQPGHSQFYAAVTKSLTAFTVITILLIILTIANAFICMHNFSNGLKEHLLRKSRADSEKADANSYNLQDVKHTQLPSRMTID
jgi:hypothetical protein